jgi:hypothetical protein
MKYPEDFKDDWAALLAPGRIHYRQVYRMLRQEGVSGVPEDRNTARDHLQQILHIDRNRAYSLSQGD